MARGSGSNPNAKSAMKAKGGSPLANASLGALASMICLVFLFPLQVAKTRMQAQTKSAENNERPKANKKPYCGALETIVRVAREEGLARLYVGLRPALVGQGLRNFIFFFAWSALEPIFARLIKRAGKAASVFIKVLQGVLAGIGVQLVCLPIGMVTARMVNNRGGHEAGSEGKVSVLSTIARVYSEGGVLRFWEGLGAGLSLTLNPGITMSVNTQVSEALVALGGESENGAGAAGLSAGQDFAVGALSKSIASAITCELVQSVEWTARGLLR